MTKKRFETVQNGQKRPENHPKMPEKVLKLAKPRSFLFPHAFPCYTEAHLENQGGLLAALAYGRPGFLGGLR